MSSHRIKSGRAVLAADVVGSGDPIVFLHANVCDSRMWRAQPHLPNLDRPGEVTGLIADNQRFAGHKAVTARGHDG